MKAEDVTEIMAPLRQRLLLAGGVDNWDWYAESLADGGYGHRDDPVTDAQDWLRALYAGGVYNWAWHDESLGASGDYEEYLEGLDSPDQAQDYETWAKAHDARKAAAEEAFHKEREAAEAREAEAAAKAANQDPARIELVGYLRRSGAVTDAEEAASLALKRAALPKHFDKAMGQVKAGASLAQARLSYVEDIITSGALLTWIEQTYGEG